MANYYGAKSSYLIRREKFERYYQSFIFLYLGFTLGFVLVKILNVVDDTSTSLLSGILVYLAVIILFAVTVRWMVKSSKKEEGNWSEGSKAEGRVYFALRSLPDDYYLYQDLKLKGHGNFDFVVCNNKNVFSIEVKSIYGKIDIAKTEDNLVVNGLELKDNPINQTYSEAKALGEYLGCEVIPILVLAGKGNVEIHQGLKPVKGVYVIGLTWLVGVITDNQNSGLVQTSISANDYDTIHEKLRFILQNKK